MTITFYAGQKDYIVKLNELVTLAGTGGGGSGTVTNVTGVAPISVATGTTTPVISIATATASVTGALSSSDWSVFNGKASISDITVANLTGTLPVDKGGTGLVTWATGNLLIGNGTGIPTLVAPSTSGNVLTSNGTTWVSSPPTGGGSALSIRDEGTELTAAATSLNFTGAGVVASNTGGAVTVTITGSGGSGGTVTDVSVATANGFQGTVATSTTTPVITLQTSISGILKGSANALTAATVGTDYSAGTAALSTGIVKTTTGTGALSVAVAGDFPTLNQNTTGTAANVTGVVGLANGGSGATTQQASLNAFAGATTSGSYLRGNGTNVVMSSIQAGDIPTLNQNTTGTASNVTGVVLGINGGTGVNNSGKTITLGGNLTTSGAHNTTITTSATTNVTLPASGTLLSTASAVTVAQGGTGLGSLTSGSVIIGAGTSSPTLVAPSTSGNVLTSNGTTWISSAPTGGGGGGVVRLDGGSFSSVSTVEYPSVFSSVYQGYTIVLSITDDSSNSDSVVLEFFNGSRWVQTGYAGILQNQQQGTLTYSAISSSVSYCTLSNDQARTLQTWINISGVMSGNKKSVVFQGNSYSSAGFSYLSNGNVSQTSTSTFTGFRIGRLSGTVSGSIQIYGYKNT